MAVYAIGDLQGCLDPLERLLERLCFDQATDQLWFVGDLVNRGPQSLEALRFVRALGDSAVTVLGNHDLHLLACAHTGRKPKKKDTLQPVLEAPDRDELLDWLRRRPLLHRDRRLDWTLVHAGIPPEWDLDTTEAQARDAEAMLRGPDVAALLEQMYGDRPRRWSTTLTGIDRLRYTINGLTRMRYCRKDGAMALDAKSAPDQAAEAGLIPWFNFPRRRSEGERIVFGHWSTLGPAKARNHTWGIDQGCLWGGCLTALQLDAPSARVTQQPCRQFMAPG
ncbi:MAG: symmetrical bis(5'-nucleosyl)-tetraphosphatase [Halothiobacillaceae bacterium]